jgi:hypothetical protein
MQFKAAVLTVLWCTQVFAVQNPDQITVFFPAFEGPGNLGLNVSTVLSLQLAQTTRRYPWPDNPKQHNFGEGMIRWSATPLAQYSIGEMTKAAQSYDLLAQIVVAGKTSQYGKDVVVELDIVLPKYQRASSTGCLSAGRNRCDYRQKNFEVWGVDLGDSSVEVDIPKRNFSISTIVLKPDVVERFSTASGLTIRDSLDGGRDIGKTDDKLRFLEFNKRLPGAPTKVRSGGVEGYVSLPELSNSVSEFSEMVGGILQTFRGDWEKAINSFTSVLDNPKTRVPLKVDALLYRGMAKFRNGQNGYTDIAAAAELAPYDHTAIRYLIMAHLASNKDKTVILDVLEKKSFLFNADDAWLNKIRSWAKKS